MQNTSAHSMVLYSYSSRWSDSVSLSTGWLDCSTSGSSRRQSWCGETTDWVSGSGQHTDWGNCLFTVHRLSHCQAWHDLLIYHVRGMINKHCVEQEFDHCICPKVHDCMWHNVHVYTSVFSGCTFCNHHVLEDGIYLTTDLHWYTMYRMGHHLYTWGVWMDTLM